MSGSPFCASASLTQRLAGLFNDRQFVLNWVWFLEDLQTIRKVLKYAALNVMDIAVVVVLRNCVARGWCLGVAKCVVRGCCLGIQCNCKMLVVANFDIVATAQQHQP